jgi:hypothetical protein
MQDHPSPASARTPRSAPGARASATAVAALAALLAGCATPLSPSAPELDARLGSATRQALAQQVLRPQAGMSADDVTAPFDGVAAVHTVARHREGFKTPPSTFGVLGIGSGTGQP